MNKRYVRQMPLIGPNGQKKLAKSKIAIIGMGALGSVAANLMVRCGIGKLILIDRDIVELSNLQRQNLYSEADIGKSKALAAKKRLKEINNLVKIEIQAVHLDQKNIEEIISNKKEKVDLILDCTDNMTTRFLINDYGVKKKINWVFASAVGWRGMLALINSKGACLRCVMPEKAIGKTCAEAGVMGPVTEMVGAIQSSIAIRYLIDDDMIEFKNKLISIDAKLLSLRKFEIKKKLKCESCLGEYPALQNLNNKQIVKFCSSGMYQVCRNFKVNLNKIYSVVKKEFSDAILDEVSLRFGPVVLFSDGRALIRCKSKERAVAIYDQFVSS